MPSIKNFLYCLNSNNSNGTNDVVGILAAMTPEYIPGQYSFSVNFSLLDLSEGEHTLSLRFKNSDGTVLSSIENATVKYEKDAKSNLPDAFVGVNVAANFQNVDIKKSGTHFMEVIFDGDTLGNFDIYVKGKNET